MDSSQADRLIIALQRGHFSLRDNTQPKNRKECNNTYIIIPVNDEHGDLRISQGIHIYCFSHLKTLRLYLFTVSGSHLGTAATVWWVLARNNYYDSNSASL
jgi:hypothetical protein